MKSSKYTGMDYGQLLRETDKAKPGRECRQIHRELKRLDKDNGLSFFERYPIVLAIVVSAVSSAVFTIIHALLIWLLT